MEEPRTVDLSGAGSSSSSTRHDVAGDLDPVGAGAASSSALESVLASFEEEVSLELVRVPVPLRAGAVLICDPNVAADAEVYNAWVKRSRAKSWRMSKDDVGVDAVKLAGLILANTCTGIEAVDPTTKQTVRLPDTFASEQLIDRLDALGPADAVRKLFAVDGHMMKAARKVADAAGMGDEFDDELEAETPTTPPSRG